MFVDENIVVVVGQSTDLFLTSPLHTWNIDALHLLVVDPCSGAAVDVGSSIVITHLCLVKIKSLGGGGGQGGYRWSVHLVTTGKRNALLN